MKNFTYVIIGLMLGCASVENQPESKYTVLYNINIIDVVNGGIIADQNVVIKDSLIFNIGSNWKAKRNQDVETVDCRGKYLMPGMWDMHFHLCWDVDNDSLLFQPLLSNGITGIRDMGGELKIQQKIKSRIRNKEITGPEIFGAGPIIDGNPPVMYDFSIPVDAETNIRKLLDSIVNQGAEFIKTYSLIQESELRKIAEYAKTEKLTFAGHLSEYIDPEVSIGLGQKSIEHLNRLDEIWNTDSIRLAQIAQEMIKKETWICPTLIIYYLKANMNESKIICEDYGAYIHPILQEEWKNSKANRLSKNDSLDWINLKVKFEEQLNLLNYLHTKGVKILAGSDFAGMPYVYPGIGLLQELKLLNLAGLSNMEVLKTATINPALYLSISDKYGSIRVNKYADLIVLDKNPLENIEHIKSINKVYRKGEKIENILPAKCLFE